MPPEIKNKIDRSLDFEKKRYNSQSESERDRDREKVKKEMGKEGKRNEKVRLDNDVSELDILGHIGTFWDNSRSPGSLGLKPLACRIKGPGLEGQPWRP